MNVQAINAGIFFYNNKIRLFKKNKILCHGGEVGSEFMS